tara:strand:+ start:9925 stop:11367 length:1443 start_codon:yes stop_codon:yes gene_type:complete
LADTFYWYDYETTGIDAARDRVVQFAGIRTDLDFNPIGSPDVFYCRLEDDVLPHPEACLVTGISPQLTREKGLLECDFIARIHQQFSTPQTCVVGYNSIRFDDEFTRHLLYRNFFDPYAREWKAGNSRWDLIDVVRLTYALRPEGINWPTREQGLPSFKLEDLSKANGIAHEAAHDALSDVRATIALAKLIKQKQTKLYTWAFGMRDKKIAAQSLDTVAHTPVVHVSGMYPSAQRCVAVVMPIVAHPINKNGVLVYDLSVDPQALINLPVEQLHQRLYTPSNELNEGESRVPLKTVHLNKSPMLAPLNTLNEATLATLDIDLQQCEVNRQKIIHANIKDKLIEVFSINNFESPTDADLMLYGGGFFSALDASNMAKIRHCAKGDLAALDLPFEDERLYEMLFRYRARNYPDTLNDDEKKQWQMHRKAVLTTELGDGRLTLSAYFERIDALIAEQTWTEEQHTLFENLIEYGESIADGLDD